MSAGSFCRSPSMGTMTSPGRVVEAGRHRRGLAEVAAQLDELQAGVAAARRASRG